LDTQYYSTVATEAARLAGQMDRAVQVMRCPDPGSHARVSERRSLVSNVPCALQVLD
jgi:hypothetical protein